MNKFFLPHPFHCLLNHHKENSNVPIKWWAIIHHLLNSIKNLISMNFCWIIVNWIHRQTIQICILKILIMISRMMRCTMCLHPLEILRAIILFVIAIRDHVVLDSCKFFYCAIVCLDIFRLPSIVFFISYWSISTCCIYYSFDHFLPFLSCTIFRSFRSPEQAKRAIVELNGESYYVTFLSSYACSLVARLWFHHLSSIQSTSSIQFQVALWARNPSL